MHHTKERRITMSRKGENIFKRKDGRWEARYIHHYEDGKAKYRYLYASTYAEVKAKKLKEQADPRNIRPASVKQLCTFRTLADVWLSDIRMSVKESTYTRYYRIVDKYLCPRIGSQALMRMDQKYLSSLPEELLAGGGIKGNPLSAKTVSDIICVLKSILKYGRKEGYPVPEANVLRCPPKVPRLVGIVSDEHRIRLERCIIERGDLTGAGILFSLYTGVRIGELCGLRWEDINFADSTVCIQRTVERIADLNTATSRKTKVVVTVPKTESSARIIPIPEFLTRFLLRFRCSPSCYLLTGSETFTEPHQYYVRYRKYLKRNLVDVCSFHALRHTFATRCVEEGFDPKALSEILGHANVTTTLSIYVHPTLQQKRAQMERLTPGYIKPGSQPAYHTASLLNPALSDRCLRSDLQ